MKKISSILMAIILVVLSACSEGNQSDNNDLEEGKKEEVTKEATEHKYVLATDDDFMPFGEFIKRYEYDDRYDELKRATFNAKWYYIGEEEYVEIPEKIQDEEVISYAGMFIDNQTIKGVKSINPLLRDTSGMFQLVDLTDSGGTLDLTEFDFSGVVEANRMFYGAKLDEINFGQQEFTELKEADELFREAEIKNLDLSTLTFPELTRLYRVFAAYKGENLNANIPSLPNLEEVDTLIGGIANNVTEIENLQINDIDLSNVSAISDIFQHFTLGGDSVLDLSNWTLPNVPREERISISDPEDTYMKISGSIIATRHGVPSIAELDISSLDGSILFREIIKSSDFKKVKIKGENEYKGYVSELSYVEDSVTEKRLEELEIEVAE